MVLLAIKYRVRRLRRRISTGKAVVQGLDSRGLPPLLSPLSLSDSKTTTMYSRTTMTT